MAEKDDYLIDMLVDLGFVSPDQVAQARQEAEASGVGVVDLMVANKAVRAEDVVGTRMAARMPRIAMTIISSIKVKPF